MTPRRRPACTHDTWTIESKYPQEELVWPECKACPCLRQLPNGMYACGLVSPKGGRYVNAAKRCPQRVVLLEDKVVDGVVLPAGQRLRVDTESSTGEGYWCIFPRTRGGVGSLKVFVQKSIVRADA